MKNLFSKTFVRGFIFLLLFALCISFVQAQEESDDPVKLFNQAQDEHAKGNLAEAIKLYDEAIKIAPDFPEAEYQRASALVSLNRPEDAEKGFRRAIELRTDWSLPYGSLGSLLVKQNRLGDAEIVLDEALRLDAKNFPALTAMTEVRLRTNASKEKLFALLGQLRSATTGARVPASVWASRGAIERKIGEKENARLSLERALMADPKNINALLERASVYEEMGDYTHALEDATAAQVIEPKLSFVLTTIARIYAHMGKTDEAMRVLDSLDESAKNTTEVQALKASLVKCDGTPEARTALEKVLEKEPQNASLLACLGAAYRIADPLRSMDYYRRAAEIEPKNIGYAKGFAAALVQARKFENAVVVLRRILTLTPEDYVAHANLATALYELKRYSEALMEFGWIAAEKPDIAITYFYMATAHDNLDDYVLALTAYEKFLSLADPKVNQLEIEKVNLRLPSLKKQVSRGEGKKKKG